MKKSTLLVGIIVLLALTAGTYLFVNSTDLKGAFSIKPSIGTDSKIKNTIPKKLLYGETLDNPWSDVHDGYEMVGAWDFLYKNGGVPCYDMSFGVVSTSGPLTWSDVFEDVRLNVGEDENVIFEQIEAGEYWTAEDDDGNYLIDESIITSSSKAAYFKMYATFKDGLDLSDSGDVSVYMRNACVRSSKGTDYYWSDSTPSSADNAYFEMDSEGTGYGISGGFSLDEML